VNYAAAGPILSVGGRTLDDVLAPAHLERRNATRHAPANDLLVSGIAAPYGVRLSDGRGGQEMFTADTSWVLPPQIPLKVGHRTVVGGATVEPAPSGLHLRGVVLGPVAAQVDGRHNLSIGYAALAEHRRPDGLRVIDRAALIEVSLVDRAAYAPFTVASVVTAPASVNAVDQPARRPVVSPIPPRPKVNLAPIAA
jgi:hypothetical protein